MYTCEECVCMQVSGVSRVDKPSWVSACIYVLRNHNTPKARNEKERELGCHKYRKGACEDIYRYIHKHNCA